MTRFRMITDTGGGTFSGNGGHPSQGRTEEIFKAGTIYHCDPPLPIGAYFSKYPGVEPLNFLIALLTWLVWLRS